MVPPMSAWRVLWIGWVVVLWSQSGAAQTVQEPLLVAGKTDREAELSYDTEQKAGEESPSDAARWAEATYPEDPFAASYHMPRVRQVGTTAGQFRMIGAALLHPGGAGPELGLHGTLELMTFAYLGVRGSLQTTLFGPSSEPLVFAAKAGASLHLLPYRRVDLSLFFEGGVGVIDPIKPGNTPMPLVSPGVSFEVWLSHWAFLYGEVHLDWGIYERATLAQKYLRVGALLGIGIAL